MPQRGVNREHIESGRVGWRSQFPLSSWMVVRTNYGRLRVRTPRQEVPPCKGPETGRAATVKREKGG